MNKVLVFTNYNSWYLGFPKIKTKVDWSDSYPELNNPLVKCVTGQGTEKFLQPVGQLSEEGVYLVYDEIGQEILAPLLDKCKQDNDRLFILIHSKGGYTHPNDFESWKEICTVAKGIHEQDLEHKLKNKLERKYEYVFNILIDDEDDKTNRIINSIFKPFNNAVISFLRECCTPNKDLEKTLSYQVLCEEGFRDALDSFRKKYDSSENYLEYKEDLEKLRSLLTMKSKNNVFLQSETTRQDNAVEH